MPDSVDIEERRLVQVVDVAKVSEKKTREQAHFLVLDPQFLSNNILKHF